MKLVYVEVQLGYKLDGHFLAGCESYWTLPCRSGSAAATAIHFLFARRGHASLGHCCEGQGSHRT